MKHKLTRLYVSDFFTFREALYWIAFRQYPDIDFTAADQEPESRFVRFRNPFDGLGMKYTYMLNGKNHLVDIRPRPPSSWKQKSKAQDEGFLIGLAETELYIKLRKGEITAYGQLLKIKIAALLDGYFSMDVYKNLHFGVCKKIPQELWEQERIWYHASVLFSQAGAYALVHIPKDALFKAYPEPTSFSDFLITTYEGAVVYQGAYIIEDIRRHIKTNKGRKAKYDWDDFDIEAATYIVQKNPKNEWGAQAAFVSHMQGWCGEYWLEVPESSQIKARCKRHLDNHFRKSAAV